MKITDDNFKIRHIYASGVIKQMSSGITEPYHIRGIDETSHMEDYFILKAFGQHFIENNAICELLGSFIAMQLDMPVPFPCLVNVERDFLETLRGQEYFSHISNAAGINFGCDFLSACQTWMPMQTLPKILLEQASNIFVFDLIILNGDRTSLKPNLLTNGETIYAIDHEKSLIPPLFRSNSDNWRIGNEEQVISSKHIFYAYLKGKSHYVSSFVDKISTLDTKFWDKAKMLMPATWFTNAEKHDLFNSIQERIIAITNNIPEYKAGIKQLLL